MRYTSPLLALLLMGVISPSPPSGECDIASVLKEVTVDPHTIAEGEYGEFEEISRLFVPASVEDGRFRASVTRKGKDVYQVDGVGLMLRTRYCYEYSYSEDVVLDLRSVGSRSFGTIHFID